MVILVTGANGDIGQAIARRFLHNDAASRLWLSVRSRRERAEALNAEFPGRCRILSLSAAEAAEWESAIAGILQTDERIDVLVNNAGLHRDHLTANMPGEDWAAVLSANLDSVFLGCRAVIRPMMAQHFGRIVNIASLSALLPPKGQSNYAAAKAGVIAFTRSLAKEVARSGITVNAVAPGYIETEALKGFSAPEKQGLVQQIPMRRFGRPDEVAAAVEFLACPSAAYITGSVLKIDGGIL